LVVSPVQDGLLASGHEFADKDVPVTHGFPWYTNCTEDSVSTLFLEIEPVSAWKESVRAAVTSILVVDDEPLIREALSRALRELGTVKAVGSGEEAVEEADSCQYELCFLDLTLPGMDGVRTGRHLHEVAPDMGIVAMTASVLSDHAARALEEFACRFLPKPFSIADAKAAARARLAGLLSVPPPRVTERRAEDRQVMLKPITLDITVPHDDRYPIPVPATLIDLSRDGMCLSLDCKVEPGTRVLVDRKPGIVRWHTIKSAEASIAGVQLVRA